MKIKQDEISDITDSISNADFCLFMDEDEIEQEFNDLDCEQETQPVKCQVTILINQITKIRN